MARNSRLSVCLAIVMRNSSQSHWMRSTKRQRTTPWIAGIGPSSTRATRAARCASVSLDGWPGGLRVTRASGPRAFNFIPPSRPMGFELHPPAAHDRAGAPADPGRLRAACPLIDRGQRQQAPRLWAILGLTSDRAQGGGVEVRAERNRHGEPLSFAVLESDPPQTRQTQTSHPKRVTPSGTWYKSQRQALVNIVESGPMPAIHGVVRWRLKDLTLWVWEEFRISLSETTLSRELRSLGYRKLSARPRHSAQNPEALEVFKKASRPPWKQSGRASRKAPP